MRNLYTTMAQLNEEINYGIDSNNYIVQGTDLNNTSLDELRKLSRVAEELQLAAQKLYQATQDAMDALCIR